MGLDKTKRILLQQDFERDPFKATNTILSAQSNTSLPTSQEDVLLAHGQNVYFSVQNSLKRLLQNDVFIQNFLSKSNDFVKYAAQHGLLSSLSSDINVDVLATAHRIYESYLSVHEYEYHGAPGSIDGISAATEMLSSVNDKYLDSNLANFDRAGAMKNFQKTSQSDGQLSSCSSFALSNDFVVKYEFDDSPEILHPLNYVNVEVLNRQTGGIFKQVMNTQLVTTHIVPKVTETKYIYKEWMSGFKELYVYIPTTYTFYNENVDGEDINKNATWIRLNVNARHFGFNHIYQTHICGQSLPMQIHNESSTISCFNDVILPSMLRTMALGSTIETDTNTGSIYNSYDSKYVFYFVCYGTDAQAIRIFGD